MTQMTPKIYKSLISLLLGLILPMLGPFVSGFAEFSEPPRNPSIITPFGEYTSFAPKGDIRRFAGETLYYDIDFLFFNKALRRSTYRLTSAADWSTQRTSSRVLKASISSISIRRPLPR